MNSEFHRPERRGRIAIAGFLFAMLSIFAVTAQAAQGYLGVHLQDLDDALLAALDLEESSHGVLVSEVVEDSPAAEAGLQRGDVIVEFDGAPAKSVRGLTRRVRRAETGDEVKLEILRKGRTKTVEVTLGESPSPRGFAFFSDDDEPDVRVFGDGDYSFGPNEFIDLRSRGRLGVRIETLDEKLGHYFGTDEGVLVLDVGEDSAAEEAGLQSGDVIVSVDGDPVEDSADLHAALSDFDAGDEVKIGYLRDKQRSEVEVELDEGNSFTWAVPDGEHFSVGRTRAPERVLERLMVAPRVRSHGLRRLHEDRGDLEAELESLKEQLQELKEQLNEMEEN